MALIDDPRAWILRLFEMEQQEGRGDSCQRFPNGTAPEGIPLDEGERVYGIYKDKYFFTPIAISIRGPGGVQRLVWKSIVRCSSQHGEGKTTAGLTLTNGETVRVRVGDLADGWSGRISQLFHQMIERHGHRASLGPPLCTIEAFFAVATDDYCLCPNLEPHPTLEEMRKALSGLRARAGVDDVLLQVADVEDSIPIVDGVVIKTGLPEDTFVDFANEYRADGIVPAPENVVRKLPKPGDGETSGSLFGTDLHAGSHGVFYPASSSRNSSMKSRRAATPSVGMAL